MINYICDICLRNILNDGCFELTITKVEDEGLERYLHLCTECATCIEEFIIQIKGRGLVNEKAQTQ